MEPSVIARTIAAQLGRETFACLGARNLLDLGDGLKFDIQGCSKINRIIIMLHPSDTYIVTFGKLTQQRKENLDLGYTEAVWETVSRHTDIYCDMLHDLIEEETGLYATLHPRT